MNARPGTGDTVYYHGTDIDSRGHKFRIISSYPVGLQVRYDLAAHDDPARVPVLEGASAASLTVIQPTSVETYNRQTYGPAGLR
jgi:hypothetical protein